MHKLSWQSGALLVLCTLTLLGTASAYHYIPGQIDWTSVINGTWEITPIMIDYGADHFGEIVTSTAMWWENYTDKALILEIANKGKSVETIVKRTLKEGTAKGYGKPRMLWIPSPAYLAGYADIARDGTNMKWVGIPTVEISYPVWYLNKLLAEAGWQVEGVPVSFTVAVRDDEHNPISTWSYGAIVISCVLLTACCLACFTVNFYKLYYHLRYTSGATTAKIFFCIDIFANFMRFWFVCVNPYYVNRFGYTWTNMCSTTHVALSLICTLLLALKWRELLLKTKLQVTIFLDTFKWPFFAFSTFIFGFQCISSAMQGHWYDISKTNIASLSILTINTFVICVLLFFSGTQIMLQIRKAVGSRRRVLQLSQTTIIILCSGFFLFVWFVLELVFLITTYKTGTNVRLINSVSVTQLFCLFFASFLQNWAMPVPIPGLGNSTVTKDSARAASKSGIVSSKKNSSSGVTDDDDTNHTNTNEMTSSPAPVASTGKEGTSSTSTSTADDSDESSLLDMDDSDDSEQSSNV